MSPRYLRKIRSWSSWFVIVALVFQPYTALANPTVVSDSEAVGSPAQIRAADIALKHGGLLQGQVLDDAGIGEANVVVQLTNGRQVWQTKTGSQGWFHIASLRGGTYQLQVEGQKQLLRAWAVGTAPPKASRGILVTPSTDVVRGQRVLSPNTNQFFRVLKQRLTNPWVVGGVIVTAVAIPVAIHNADDDDPPATP